MAKIIWGKSYTPIFFHDLEVGDTFKLCNGEAIYQKVKAGRAGICNPDCKGLRRDEAEEFMLEIATGLLWPVSKNTVKLVDVEVTINANKPALYSL